MYWYTTRNNSLCTDYNNQPYKRFKAITENIECRKAFAYIWVNLKEHNERNDELKDRWKLKGNLGTVKDLKFPNGCFLEQSDEFGGPTWTVKWNSHSNGRKNVHAQQICKKGNTLNLIFNM